MSGIAGILHHDGRPVDAAALQQMAQAMAHRGPDGRAIWAAGRAGLVRNHFRSLPETPVEVGSIAEGDLALVADVRLDNRADLASALGLAGAPLSDAALVLAAYRRWGEDCPRHLLGDFAFAIFDSRRDLLFCARDHFGVKPFHYHVGAAGTVVFASELKALFVLPQVPRRIDEARIADYLVALMDDAASTLYADILRLPPAHRLTVTRAGLRLSRYWRLDTPAEPGGDPVEELRALFTEAVRCRLRGAGSVGAMLSGGLDSSSIACVAAPLRASENRPPLPTLSLVFDKTPEWNERPFIEAVLAQGGFDPSLVEADDYAPFADFDRILAEQDSAFLAPGLAVARRVYHAAAGRGVRVLLDGHGGDEVISHGHGRLHELALANRWLTLWREVHGVADTFGDSPWPIFSAYLNRYGPGRPLRRVRRFAARALGRAGPPVEERPAWSRIVNADLAARSDLRARYGARRQAEAAAIGSEQARHALLLSSARVPHAFEVLDRAAATAGVEPRYPFWDKRVVEFCLSLPSSEKLKDGWSRSILRRAMEGILPAAVQWRRDKLDFAPHIIRGMLARHRDLLDGVIHRDADGVGAYADLAEVAAAYERVVARAEAADGNDVQIVWRTTVLSLWLRRMARSPADRVAA